MFEEIRILAELQDACINDNNEYRQELLKSLPHIVVVGSQSVGKTSLLESLIGFDDVFPKGNGTMVTRCAVALQLVYDREMEFEAELLNSALVKTIHHTPASLRSALDKHMRGIQDWISDEVIRVKIKSSRTPDLCLMDLPGLIQLPSQDQPRNLDVQIKTLVRKYASLSEAPVGRTKAAAASPACSIILAVTCATNDLANSEALRVARELDPSGERTIGVLTKCDLVSDLVSVKTMISSTVHSKYPLKLGYVFIVNRQNPIQTIHAGSSIKRSSSRPNAGGGGGHSGGHSGGGPYGEVDTKVGLGGSLGGGVGNLEVTRSTTESEGDYFDQDSYRTVRSMCGIGALKTRLRNVLSSSIRQFTEERYHQFRNDLVETELELRDLGPDHTEVNTPSLILNLVSKYCRAIDDLLEGKIGEHTDLPRHSAKAGGGGDGWKSSGDLKNHNASQNSYRLPSTGLDANPAEAQGGSAENQPTCNGEDEDGDESQVVDPSRTNRRHELVGGARLNFVFQDWFRPSIMKLDGLDSMDDFEIRTAIRNSSGCSSSLFIPESVFESLVRKQIKRLENPVLQCVRQSVKELKTLLNQPLQSPKFLELRKYPQLLTKIVEVVNNCVVAREERCVSYTQDLIKSETAYIDKNHPEFIQDKEKLQEYFFRPIPSRREATPQPRDNHELASTFSPYPVTQTDPAVFVNDGCPSTFMSFWRKHPITGSYMKPKASPGNNMPASQSSQMASNKLNVTSTAERCQDLLPVYDQDSMLIEIVKMLIRSYFAIVKKSLAALVPKVIMYFLVNATREDIHGQLVMHLYNESTLDSLLVESEEISNLRKNLKARQRALQDACMILETIAKKYNLNIE